MKDLKQELEALSILLNETKEAMNFSLNLLTNRIEDALKEANEKQKPTIRLVPFDVEKAKQGAKIVTKDRHNVRILCYDSKCVDDQPIVTEIYTENGATLTTHGENGAFYHDGREHSYDLMIEEE